MSDLFIHSDLFGRRSYPEQTWSRKKAVNHMYICTIWSHRKDIFSDVLVYKNVETTTTRPSWETRLTYNPHWSSILYPIHWTNRIALQWPVTICYLQQCSPHYVDKLTPSNLRTRAETPQLCPLPSQDSLEYHKPNLFLSSLHSRRACRPGMKSHLYLLPVLSAKLSSVQGGCELVWRVSGLCLSSTLLVLACR